MKRVFNSTIALILCICVIFSGSVIAFAADVATPTKVTISSITESGATISWGSVNDVKGYFVYRSTKSDGGWEELGKTVDLSNYIEKPSAPTSGQILQWNGTAWVAASLPLYDGSVT